MNTEKKNKKNGSGNKNHDVAGIICVVISSFFLICLITPLLSDIGNFVKYLTTGLFGYISYPIVLCTLLYGILLLMNKKAAITGKQIAFIILMAVCVILILQTALDTNVMRDGFGEYLSTLMSTGKSVGGVFFGIFVYAIKSILTFVGAYILYSLLLVVFGALLVFDFVSGRQKSVVRQTKREPAPFVKGQSVAQPVRDVNDTSLFVGTIEHTNKVTSHSGDFASIYSPVTDTLPRYESAPEYTEQEDASAQAKKILFGDAEEMFKNYESQLRGNMNIGDYSGGRSNYLIDDSFVLSKPNTVTAAPDITPQPKPQQYEDAPQYGSMPQFGSTQQYGNTEQYGSTQQFGSKPQYGSNQQYENPLKTVLPDVAIPPEKDITDQLIDGPILNGDEVSRSIQDSKRLRRPEEERRPEPDAELPPIITGNPTIKNNRVSAPEKEPQKVDLPPILNGDIFTAKTEVEEVEEEITPKFDSVIREVEKEEKVETKEVHNQPVSPIVDADVFDADNAENNELSIDEEFDIGENLSYIEAENQSDNQEPIVSGDDFVMPEEEAVEYETTEPETEEEEQIQEQPIISGDYVSEESIREEAAKSYEEQQDLSEQVFEMSEELELGDIEIQDEEEQEAVEAEAPEISQADSEVPEQDAIEEEVSDEEKFEAKIPDTLKFVDEEIDMSETSEEIDNDNTGYYVTEGFNNNVKELSKKLNDNDNKLVIKKGVSDNNQINMEDYDVVVPETQPKKPKKHLRYTPPPFDLLINSSTSPNDDVDYEANARSLEEVLHNLKVDAKVIKITRGPAVTRYEMEMPLGQSVKRIPNCADDIAYSLASNGAVRIEAPIKGKRAVGVEVPNQSIAIVSLREIIDSKEFSEAKSYLTLALGKDITGNIITCNLEKMPHLLIAGTTGSGKSACLNSIIISVLYKASPDDVRLILIDPKQVEFVLYRDMPHLLMKNIINDCNQAINAFKWAREEMDRRYTLFAKYSVRNLSDFNDCSAVKTGAEPKLPRIVIIVDELGELMLAKNSKELEQHIMSIAQKARAAGMHLILATQRPSVDVLTGTIKANLPSRIAFAVKSIPDSRTILDQVGAETLLGRGDMLYAPLDSNDPQRVQGAYITTEEIENIVNFVRSNNEADYDEAAENFILKKQEEENMSATPDEEKSGGDTDPLMKDVLRKVIETRQASASQIQRRFAVGYNRASRILDQMEENGYIGPLDGAKPREVYITREKFIELYGEDI